MSELKAYKMVNAQYLTDRPCVIPADVYFKSEADKVIAELEESHKTEVKELLCLIRDKENNFNRAFDSVEKELRHQKYKRCLTMAKWCASRSASWCLDPADDELHKSDFYDKWKLRWLGLAEKFKEGT